MMTDDEVRAELVAWGAFNEKTGLDVSLARYREIAEARARDKLVGPSAVVEMTAEPDGVPLPDDPPKKRGRK